MRKHAYKRVLIGQVTTMLLVVMNTLVLATADATAAPHERMKGTNIWANQIKRTGLVDQQFASAYDALQQGEYDQAVFTLGLLAEQGHTDAQFYLGLLYGRGVGVHQDAIKAIEWFREAAEHGHVDAQYELGLAYAAGTAVTGDAKQAAHWWRAAAIGGNTDAQYNLGLLYAQGEGVVRNMMEAARWWHQAATHGDAAAQYALGLMFARGDGVTQDLGQAIKWWYLSARQGFERAQAALTELGRIAFPQ